MGMFDSLYVQCPSCHEPIEFQSKAGPCGCDNYTILDCPPAIAGDLIGDSEKCKCGHEVKLAGYVRLWVAGTSPNEGSQQPKEI